MLAIGVWKLLVGNRVDVCLTRGSIRLLLPPLFPVKGASKWRPYGSEPPVAWTGQTSMASSWTENPTGKVRLLLKHQRHHRHFRCKDNSVAFMHVQPHYHHMRQVEPCYQLGWSSQALILNILALGAMPQQQQQHRGFKSWLGCSDETTQKVETVSHVCLDIRTPNNLCDKKNSGQCPAVKVLYLIMSSATAVVVSMLNCWHNTDS